MRQNISQHSGLWLLTLPSLHSHQKLKTNLYNMGTLKPALLLCICTHISSVLLCVCVCVCVCVVGGFQAVGISLKVIVPPAINIGGQDCLPAAFICNFTRPCCLCKPQGHVVQLMTGVRSVHCVTASHFSVRAELFNQ